MKIAFAILVLSNSISFPVKAGVVDKALLSMIHYSKLETPDKSTMIMATVSKDKLPDLYPVCMEKAFTYDLLNYNCTIFATECWYLLTGQDLRCNSPYELRHKIMDVEDGVEGCYTMLETDCFYSYYRSSGRFLKYEPREER